jgi:phospholipid/cholesterol/gamma-HCH transport system permease protein
MPASPALTERRSTLLHELMRHARSWWHMLHVGSVVLVLALSPGSYTPQFRRRTAQHIYTSTWQVMSWFTALAALLSLVVIRIVVVTALSYGLSQYALQMVVRVLVLELIPLCAALFVALRAGMAFNAGAADEAGRQPAARGALDLVHLQTHLAPRVLADAFAVLALATLSSVVVLVLAYLTVYGFSPWGLAGFTRTVGQVFDLPVSLGFALKTLFFSLAVAVVPLAASLEAEPRRATDTIQPGAVRLLLVLFLLEALSLAVKYI